MTRSPLTLAIAAAFASGLATAAFAVQPDKGAVLGSDAATIAAALAEDGFELTRFNRAPALIHLTAVKDNQRHLILVSSRDGTVISHRSGALRATPTAAIPTATAPALPADLADRLAAQGYTLTRVKSESYGLEVYATRAGRM